MDTQNKIIWPGWETGRVIGRGSFGTVYEIRRDVLGDIERAALKHISIPASEEEIISLQSEGMDAASITKTFREQLNDIVNEYKLMRRLNDCPYVVRCDDVQYIQKQDGFGWDIFIKMELLTPVTRLLGADTEIAEEKVVALGKDISRALIRCGEQNILHRDIKIQNIFVSEDGKYKLGDFGIARAKERTSTGTARVGTYDYMAPEVYFGKRYDKTADIYSLGMVLYWLLNNRRMPFLPQTEEAPRMQDRENARMRRLNGEKLPPPANGSKGLQKIVLKCCAYKPENRYRDPSDLLNDLLTLTRKPAVKKAAPAKRGRHTDKSNDNYDRLPELAAKSEDILQPEEIPEPKATRKKRSGWRIVWRIIGVIYLLIAIAVGVIVYQAKHENREEEAWVNTLGHFDNISELVDALNAEETASTDDTAKGIFEIGTKENTIICKYCLKSMPEIIAKAQNSDKENIDLYNQVIVTMPEFKEYLETELNKSFSNVHVDLYLMIDEYSDVVVASVENGIVTYDLVNNIGTAPVGITPITERPSKNGRVTYESDNNTGIMSTPLPAGSKSEANGLLYEVVDDCIVITGYEGNSNSVAIPNRIYGLPVLEIGDHAFSSCKNLVEITIPNSVKTINSSAFIYCISLKKITIPEGLETIGNNAFYFCKALETIILPQTLKNIGSNAFSWCKSLTNIAIPKSVIHVEDSVFSSCGSLRHIYADPGSYAAEYFADDPRLVITGSQSPSPASTPDPAEDPNTPHLFIENVTYPKDMPHGSALEVYGDIYTDKGVIAMVSGYIVDADGNRLVDAAGNVIQSNNFYPYTETFSLAGTVNAVLKFGELKPGIYTYIVSAIAENDSFSSGSVTLIEHTFEVY